MYANVSDLAGKICSNVVQISDDEIHFYVNDGDDKVEHYALLHHQSCCEKVYIEDISGELNDLIGSPLVIAEEVNSEDPGPLTEWTESHTWTFYKFATDKGYVTIRWYGTSNGYYSESVSFIKVEELR